jgi:hypothetical protein
MHTSSRLVTLKIPLPRRDHRVFLAARRILVRIMGAKAPDAIGLIQQYLRGRDARGLADEYLDTVGVGRWPAAARSRCAAGGKSQLRCGRCAAPSHLALFCRVSAV